MKELLLRVIYFLVKRLSKSHKSNHFYLLIRSENMNWLYVDGKIELQQKDFKDEFYIGGANINGSIKNPMYYSKQYYDMVNSIYN